MYHKLILRGRAAGQLVGLITQRSGVRIPPSLQIQLNKMRTIRQHMEITTIGCQGETTEGFVCGSDELVGDIIALTKTSI